MHGFSEGTLMSDGFFFSAYRGEISFWLFLVKAEKATLAHRYRFQYAVCEKQLGLVCLWGGFSEATISCVMRLGHSEPFSPSHSVGRNVYIHTAEAIIQINLSFFQQKFKVDTARRVCFTLSKMFCPLRISGLLECKLLSVLATAECVIKPVIGKQLALRSSGPRRWIRRPLVWSGTLYRRQSGLCGWLWSW